MNHPVQTGVTITRTVTSAPKVFLATLFIAAGIYKGCIGPEDYAAECRPSHHGHAAYVAEHPGTCE
jgi:hypothetical protein